MQHLTLEALARLVDEAPDAAQAAHLAGCAACRLEIDALRQQSSALAQLPDIEPPPGAWPALEQRLRHEGLLPDERVAESSPAAREGTHASSYGKEQAAAPADEHTTAPSREHAVTPIDKHTGSGAYAAARAEARRAATSGATRVWSRAATLRRAASIALFLFGGAAGFAVRGIVAPVPVTVVDAQRMPSAEDPSAGEATAAANSAEEVAQQVRRTEAEYLDALTRYAQVVDSPAATDPVARFAALESIVLATRAALDQAPADPVINGYHLTALAQREAMLRHFAATTDDNWF